MDRHDEDDIRGRRGADETTPEDGRESGEPSGTPETPEARDAPTSRERPSAPAASRAAAGSTPPEQETGPDVSGPGIAVDASRDDLPLESEDDVALADRLKAGNDQIRAQLHKLIVGQERVIDEVILTLFAGGNSIITGVPGLAKTLLIQSLAEVLDLKFSRIQFTPDLMPSDITGTEVIQSDPETGLRNLVFVPGPVFTNILLADEINRTPPKTQSALLEAMQEHRVTVQGDTYQLEEPFHVFATQNPIELEGTYPLPEAQLDRFMFNVIIEHMPEDDELQVVRETTSIQDFEFETTITGPDILRFQRLVRRVPVSDPVLQYAVDLVRATRPENDVAPEFIGKWVEFGVSVRAAQYLILGGKARALLDGRYTAGFEDIRTLAPPVLRHRILTNFHAESEGITTDRIVSELLDAVAVPSSRM